MALRLLPVERRGPDDYVCDVVNPDSFMLIDYNFARAYGVTERVARERAQLFAAAQEMREVLEALTKSLRELIANSDGVAGLHLNGDVATWDELLAGGSFEDWLKVLDEAEDVLREAREVTAS